jgi:hypothetical protein
LLQPPGVSILGEHHPALLFVTRATAPANFSDDNPEPPQAAQGRQPGPA